MVFQGSTESFDDMCRQASRASRLEHVHHAGNSSGVVDGASALLLASPGYARAHGLVPFANSGDR